MRMCDVCTYICTVWRALSFSDLGEREREKRKRSTQQQSNVSKTTTTTARNDATHVFTDSRSDSGSIEPHAHINTYQRAHIHIHTYKSVESHAALHYKSEARHEESDRERERPYFIPTKAIMRNAPRHTQSIHSQTQPNARAQFHAKSR